MCKPLPGRRVGAAAAARQASRGHFIANSESFSGLKLNEASHHAPQKVLTSSRNVYEYSACQHAPPRRCHLLGPGTRSLTDDCLLIVYRCARSRTHSPHSSPFPDCLLIVYRCTRTHSPHPPLLPDCLLIVYRCTPTQLLIH